MADRLHVIMANAISVRTTLEPENLRIPDLELYIFALDHGSLLLVNSG